MASLGNTNPSTALGAAGSQWACPFTVHTGVVGRENRMAQEAPSILLLPVLQGPEDILAKAWVSPPQAAMWISAQGALDPVFLVRP